MLQIVGAHRVRIQIDAAEVDDPKELRGVAHDDLARSAARWKAQLHRLDPIRMPLRSALLEEGLPLGAVHVAFEDDGPARDAAQRTLGDGGVVLREIELGVPGAREEDLVRVGDHHLAAGDLHDRAAVRAGAVRRPRRRRQTPARLSVRPMFSAACLRWPRSISRTVSTTAADTGVGTPASRPLSTTKPFM